MKIAIATIDKNADSEISNRGGRAPYYLIFDEKGELIETMSNPFTAGGGGAGFGVAKMLADAGVDIFVAGAIGDNATITFKERGVRCCGKTGSVRQAIKEIIEDSRK